MKIQAPVFGHLMDVVAINGYYVDEDGERCAEVSFGPFTAYCFVDTLVIVGAEVA